MTAPTPPPCSGSGRMVNPGPPGPPRYFCCVCGTELDARDLEGGGKGAGGIWSAKLHVSPWWRAPVGKEADADADLRAEAERLTLAERENVALLRHNEAVARKLMAARDEADHWRAAYTAVGLVMIDYMAQHHRRALNLGAGGCDCELCIAAREKGIRPAADPAYRAALTGAPPPAGEGGQPG